MVLGEHSHESDAVYPITDEGVATDENQVAQLPETALLIVDYAKYKETAWTWNRAACTRLKGVHWVLLFMVLWSDPGRHR